MNSHQIIQIRLYGPADQRLALSGGQCQHSVMVGAEHITPSHPSLLGQTLCASFWFGGGGWEVVEHSNIYIYIYKYIYMYIYIYIYIYLHIRVCVCVCVCVCVNAHHKIILFVNSCSNLLQSPSMSLTDSPS